MRKYIALLLICIILNNTGCTGPNNKKSSSEATIIPIGTLKVSKIVDGDTFWVLDSMSKELKIRLIGVDAPESRKTGKKEIGYYGKDAKLYLTNLLSGKRVRLEYDIDTFDQYGRILGYVYLEDETFVNANLVENGYAMVMTVPPNVKFADSFINLQIEARNNRKGLWANRLSL